MPALEGYDLVMIGILAGAAVIGYFKGFLWQLAWIAGIVVSSIAAIRFGGVAAPFFGQQAPWNRLLAMLAIYAASSIGVWLVFRVVSGAVNAVHLSSFDHQLGLLFGVAKGALLCIVITFFAVTLAPAYRDQIVNSRSGRLVAELIVKADAILPKDLHDIVDPFVKQFEEKMAVPAGMPQPAGAAGGPSPSPLATLLEGLGSVSAWVGADQAIQAAPAGGQGGSPSPAVQQAGGPLPPGSSWFVPATPATASSASPQPAPRAASSPGQFPVGSQTPLPIR